MAKSIQVEVWWWPQLKSRSLGDQNDFPNGKCGRLTSSSSSSKGDSNLVFVPRSTFPELSRKATYANIKTCLNASASNIAPPPSWLMVPDITIRKVDLFACRWLSWTRYRSSYFRYNVIDSRSRYPVVSVLWFKWFSGTRPVEINILVAGVWGNFFHEVNKLWLLSFLFSLLIIERTDSLKSMRGVFEGGIFNYCKDEGELSIEHQGR